MKWFRWYRGSCEDGKFRHVARESRVTVRDVVALWALLLEDAARLDHRGVCLHSLAYLEAVLDFEKGAVHPILKAMHDATLIELEKYSITICNFKQRQFDSDADGGARERQKRKRERDKATKNGSVTRDTLPPDTDTDTDTDKKESPPTPSGGGEKKEQRGRKKPAPSSNDETFARFRAAFPEREGRHPWTDARKRFDRIVAAGVDPEHIIAGARAFADAEAKKVGTEFIPMVTTWLNQVRWKDFAPTVAEVPRREYQPTPEQLAARKALDDKRREAKAAVSLLAEGAGVCDQKQNGMDPDTAW